MLTALRGSAGGLIAKIFIGLLAASFAVWGVADVFRGYRSDVLATAGDTEVTVPEFQDAFNRRVRVLSARLGRALTPQEARGLGVDRQVLGELLRDGALMSQAKDMKLALSGKVVAERVSRNPAFQNTDGKFNAADFRRLLEANGLSEQEFVSNERQGLVRQAITASLNSSLVAPDTLVEIAWRQRNEQRDASYFDIPASAVKVPEPSKDEIAKYYKDNQSEFMIPERRTIAAFVLDVPSIAKNISVDDTELKTTYERDNSQFGTPEKRDVQQIAFPSIADAEAALKRIRGGEDFMKVATERGLSAKDVSLGTVVQSDIPDEAIAKAAFALKDGEVSDPVKGKLAVALVRVMRIVPGAIKPLSEVRGQLEKEIKTRHAREQLLDLHDHIEDERAGGQSFEQIANKNDLKLLVLDNVDRQGHLADGKEVESFPGKPQILKAAFESDVGVENDPVAIGQDAFGWYEVRGVEPSKARPLDDARGDVIAAWKDRKLRELLLAKARALQARAEKGEAFDKLAAEVGAGIKQASGLKRNESTAQFPPADVAALFSTAPDGFASVIGSDGKTARVMHSTPVMIPPFDAKSVEAQKLREALDKGLANDVFTGYLRELQAAIGVKVNQDLWRRVSGSSS